MAPRVPIGESTEENQTYDACPHCGAKLSPWQQVLLNVDRALVCKRCWYRITLGIPPSPPEQEKK